MSASVTETSSMDKSTLALLSKSRNSNKRLRGVYFSSISIIVRTLSYIRVLGVIELIEFNHSGLFGVVG